MEDNIPLGNCMVIDRKTGKVLQWERTTPERMKAAARVIAKTLVDELMKDGKIAFLKDYTARKKKEVAHRGEER